jgi:hypothetical protein
VLVGDADPALLPEAADLRHRRRDAVVEARHPVTVGLGRDRERPALVAREDGLGGRDHRGALVSPRPRVHDDYT